ncbi:MAG: PEP-CTERM sorting domain-containing protein [Oscillatoria sp. PMC 1051.18]|nr:PEP-CTERM sorting domain-containing protein [Oscillatoria sp. PMC 1050.18]MEC5030769.1 PEP-CTERM sorting domain-containing protein [Oscillatoria sp. PMC 1051.18]
MSVFRTAKNLVQFSVTVTGLTLLGLAISESARAASFTVGGYTWDEANTVTSAEVVEGDLAFDLGFRTAFNPGSSFDPSKSIGQLLGFESGGPSATSVPFPDSNSTEALPNVDRATIELSWGGLLLPNFDGEDFVIYEAGSATSPEGFSVSVFNTLTNEWTNKRYEFFDSFDQPNGVLATAFDLDDFGLDSDALISAIRITNLFNSEAANGADKVDDPSGEGNVLFAGNAGYEDGFALLNTANGSEYPTGSLDTDLVYLAGLHDIISSEPTDPTDPTPVPEPTSVLSLLAFGLVSVSSFLKRKK